jgi:hypothetical protein
MRSLGGGGDDEGGTRYNMNTYLRERGDAEIRSLSDLIEKANHWEDPRMPNRVGSLQRADSARTLATAATLQTRFAVRTIVLQAFAELELDAVIYPSGNVPPAILRFSFGRSPRSSRPSRRSSWRSRRGSNARPGRFYAAGDPERARDLLSAYTERRLLDALALGEALVDRVETETRERFGVRMPTAEVPQGATWRPESGPMTLRAGRAPTIGASGQGWRSTPGRTGATHRRPAGSRISRVGARVLSCAALSSAVQRIRYYARGEALRVSGRRRLPMDREAAMSRWMWLVVALAVAGSVFAGRIVFHGWTHHGMLDVFHLVVSLATGATGLILAGRLLRPAGGPTGRAGEAGLA